MQFLVDSFGDQNTSKFFITIFAFISIVFFAPLGILFSIAPKSIQKGLGQTSPSRLFGRGLLSQR